MLPPLQHYLHPNYLRLNRVPKQLLQVFCRLASHSHLQLYQKNQHVLSRLHHFVEQKNLKLAVMSYRETFYVKGGYVKGVT